MSQPIGTEGCGPLHACEAHNLHCRYPDCEYGAHKQAMTSKDTSVSGRGDAAGSKRWTAEQLEQVRAEAAKLRAKGREGAKDEKAGVVLRYVRLNGPAADFDIVNEHGGRVASTPYEQHAKRIVEACNSLASHQEQVKRLREVNAELARLLNIAFTKYQDAESCYEDPTLQRGFTGKMIQLSDEDEVAMVDALDAYDASLTSARSTGDAT